MTHAWWQIKISLPATARDGALLLGERLIALGTDAVEQQRRRRKFCGLRVHYPGHFKRAALSKAIRVEIKSLRRFFPVLGRAKITMRRFTDESWKEKWKAYAKPIVVDEHLAILPRHIKKIPANFPKNAHILHMDPGMAFGTGGHATTFLCLQAMSALIEKQKPANCLDVGTGSGILAIAARLLGVPKINAVDNDPLAVEVARENAATHRVGKHIDFQIRSIENISGKYELIVANILLKVLAAYAGTLAQHLQPKGWLILSGLLVRQEADMRRAMRGTGLRVVGKATRKGWLCLVARKTG